MKRKPKIIKSYRLPTDLVEQIDDYCESKEDVTATDFVEGAIKARLKKEAVAG